MTDTFRCPRCAADPKPEGWASERNCAFDASGNFTPDNWNCATLNLLIVSAMAKRNYDETLEYVHTHLDDGEDENGGWIVTTRYKSRGCTSSAIWVGDFYPPQPVTLALVERVLTARAMLQQK